MQNYENLYKPPFDRGQWGLIEVAQLANFMGTIWATWDKNAPSFDEYLGEAKFALDAALRGWDGSENGTELLGSVQKWIIPSNWKFVAENFAGDWLHTVSHKSVEMVGIGPGAAKTRRDEAGAPATAAYPEGHGITYRIVPPNKDWVQYAASPATSAYYRACWEKRVDRMGEKAGVFALVGTIFPNMSFHGQQPRTILVAHPRGTQKTEMWRFYFVDKTAPTDVRDYLRHYAIRYSGPAGLTEQDDMENWNYASAASAGMIARRYPYNYKASLNMWIDHDVIPGVVWERSDGTEGNPRALYKRWAEYMDAKNWADLRETSEPV